MPHGWNGIQRRLHNDKPHNCSLNTTATEPSINPTNDPTTDPTMEPTTEPTLEPTEDNFFQIKLVQY